MNLKTITKLFTAILLSLILLSCSGGSSSNSSNREQNNTEFSEIETKTGEIIKDETSEINGETGRNFIGDRDY